MQYILVPLNATEAEDGCDEMKALYDYVRWLLTDELASSIAKELSFATMPNIIAEKALDILDNMKCTDRFNSPLLLLLPFFFLSNFLLSLPLHTASAAASSFERATLH
eukprot:807691-Rhodomonas_salina.3